MQKLHGEAEHVGKRQHVQHCVSWLEKIETVDAELYVAPEVAVGEHHAFGEAGGAGGIIYQSQIAAIVHGVIYVFGGEDSRIAFAEKSVVVFGGKCHFLGTREQQTAVGNPDCGVDCRHTVGADAVPCVGVGKQQAGFAVVHQMFYCFRSESRKNRHTNSTVCKAGKDAYCPFGTVAAAESYLVADGNTGMCECEVIFGYFHGNIAVAVCHSVDIGESRKIPVVAYGLADIFCQCALLFHCVALLADVLQRYG